MKRYLVFAYSDERARGGWDDFRRSYDQIGEAIAYLDAAFYHRESGHVVDSQKEWEVVYRRPM